MTRVASDAAIAAIGNKTNMWVRDNALKEKMFDTSKLPDLIDFIAVHAAGELKVIADTFCDRSIYPQRPAVRLYGCEGTADGLPDVWLLGWRDTGPEPERTVIHDHDDSRVVVRVLQGEVLETRYTFEGSKISSVNLTEGQVSFIEAPCIHEVSDISDHHISVTLHGYFPQLDTMHFYRLASGRLERTETWREPEGAKCQF